MISVIGLQEKAGNTYATKTAESTFSPGFLAILIARRLWLPGRLHDYFAVEEFLAR